MSDPTTDETTAERWWWDWPMHGGRDAEACLVSLANQPPEVIAAVLARAAGRDVLGDEVERLRGTLAVAAEIIAARGLGDYWGTRKPIPRALALLLAPHHSEWGDDVDAEAWVDECVRMDDLKVEA